MQTMAAHDNRAWSALVLGTAVLHWRLVFFLPAKRNRSPQSLVGQSCAVLALHILH